MRNFTIQGAIPTLQVADPGLYSIDAVGTAFCRGEILEPSACVLSNPPEPSLTVSHSVIPDRCAKKSVGIVANVDLRGTPPFRIGYSIQRSGDKATRHSEKFDLHHGQLELRPLLAGHYTYEFDTISDSIYKRPQAAQGEGLALEQDIIPPASARFAGTVAFRKVCIGEPVSFDVEILGDGGPFVLEYELLHNGGRRKPQRSRVINIESNKLAITTEKLHDGGQYTLALISIADNTGCKSPLNEEVKIDVGLQKPKVAFGTVDQKRSLLALEGKEVNLPLRLQGTPPWSLSFSNLDYPNNTLTARIYESNDNLAVSLPGHYEILSVDDAACPGVVDVSAKDFDVVWIPRPTVRVSEDVTPSKKANEYIRRGVCEGDEDSIDIMFSGSPPFSLSYEQRHTEASKMWSTSSRSIKAGLHAATIRLDTSVAGTYDYNFVKLEDYMYNHDPRTFEPLQVQQQVYPRPTASFTNAGKTYKYCKEKSAGEGEKIPINLIGSRPFDLEIEIKHHASTKPEMRRVSKIDSGFLEYVIPQDVLALGTHAVTIRSVRDSRGCERKMDFNAPHVQVSVAEVPTISASEERVDYCVGDRIAYTLSGTPPFNCLLHVSRAEPESLLPYNRLQAVGGDSWRIHHNRN